MGFQGMKAVAICLDLAPIESLFLSCLSVVVWDSNVENVERRF